MQYDILGKNHSSIMMLQHLLHSLQNRHDWGSCCSVLQDLKQVWAGAECNPPARTIHSKAMLQQEHCILSLSALQSSAASTRLPLGSQCCLNGRM